MARKVKIRFLGANFYRGIPSKRFIDVGGERFWNYNRFKEQGENGTYIRPLAFFEKHKEILSDSRHFVIEFIDEKKTTKLQPALPPTVVELTPDLVAKGVTEVEGILQCPQCDFISERGAEMGLHLIEAHGA